jgi:hypothetical protein
MTALDLFDDALGKSILREMTVMGVELPPDVVEGAPAELNISSARHWRSFHRAQLRSLALVAARAEGLSDGTARISFARDLNDDADGAMSFLEAASPTYLACFVKNGLDLEGEEFCAFLRLLQRLPE